MFILLAPSHQLTNLAPRRPTSENFLARLQTTMSTKTSHCTISTAVGGHFVSPITC